MKSFIIAWKDFLIRAKDRKGFLLLLLMPVLLTAILGSALGNVMGENGANFPKTIIGIVKPDKDALVNQYIDDVLQSKELSPYIKIKELKSADLLALSMRNQKVDVGIVFPEKWSEHLNQGELKDLTIYSDPGKTIQSDIVQAITHMFVSRVQTVAVSGSTVIETIGKKLSPHQLPKVSEAMISELKGAAGKQGSAVDETSIGEKSISGLQYYAAAMGAMFLLFNITVGAKSIIDERDTQTLSRLLSTPTSKLTILIGKFLGTLYFAFAQFVVFVLATRVFFGVDWGNNPAQTIAVGAAFAVSVSGLSMLVAATFKSEKTADMVGAMGVQIMAILGGSMVPITIFPETLRNISHFVPNTWALTSLTNIMVGTSWQTLYLPIAVLLIIGLVAVTAGTLRLQAR